MEEKQVIISISREFGSGGRTIATEIAKRFNLPLYDYNLLKEIAREKNGDAESLEKYDEIPKCRLFSRRVKGFSNSPEEIIANLQFDFLRQRAKEGQSFVVVGRCSEEILKEYKCLISIFVLGDMDKKIDHIADINHLSHEEAERLILHRNKKRKAYHNYYCSVKWGDSRNYDLSINSSKMGIDETANIIEEYIRKRIKLF